MIKYTTNSCKLMSYVKLPGTMISDGSALTSYKNHRICLTLRQCGTDRCHVIDVSSTDVSEYLLQLLLKISSKRTWVRRRLRKYDVLPLWVIRLGIIPSQNGKSLHCPHLGFSLLCSFWIHPNLFVSD